MKGKIVYNGLDFIGRDASELMPKRRQLAVYPKYVACIVCDKQTLQTEIKGQYHDICKDCLIAARGRK